MYHTLPKRNTRGAGEIPSGRARGVGAQRAPDLDTRSHSQRFAQYDVRLDASDYSVDPTAIGRMVDVTADLDRVRVRLDGRIVADHRRVWARGAVVTDSAHRDTAKLLRQHFQQPRQIIAADELTRDLADYDRAFGIEGVA